MGYDDNSRLSGITGGGLPATIWQETMARVLAGQTPTPLPVIIPQQPESTGILESRGGEAPAQDILNLLDSILTNPN